MPVTGLTISDFPIRPMYLGATALTVRLARVRHSPYGSTFLLRRISEVAVKFLARAYPESSCFLTDFSVSTALLSYMVGLGFVLSEELMLSYF